MKTMLLTFLTTSLLWFGGILAMNRNTKLKSVEAELTVPGRTAVKYRKDLEGTMHVSAGEVTVSLRDQGDGLKPVSAALDSQGRLVITFPTGRTVAMPYPAFEQNRMKSPTD